MQKLKADKKQKRTKKPKSHKKEIKQHQEKSFDNTEIPFNHLNILSTGLDHETFIENIPKLYIISGVERLA